MEDGLAGDLVPVVKSEVIIGSSDAGKMVEIGQSETTDKDLLCPICMQIIKDAFLTPCGHSFCYMCIITHLDNKSDCPCCDSALTTNQLYPNFLLDKLLKKTSASQASKSASPLENNSIWHYSRFADHSILLLAYLSIRMQSQYC